MRRVLLAVLVALAACQPRGAERPAAAPGTRLEAGIVASAHPLASAAGLEVLRAGGNAVDAAVAAAFAVGVVEPMMAGIGGSGSMLIWHQREARADYLDFYARAPAELPADAAERRRDHPARLVAVPGTVAGLLAAHARFGRLERAAVLEPAIRLAAVGFPVSGLLARAIAADSARLGRHERARELFWPGGRPLAAGEPLVQPELAATMRRIALEGRQGFQAGAVAREIVSVLRAGGSTVTVQDLAGFEPVWRRPLCGVYRGRAVLSAPPPQSGMQVIQTLQLLEPHDLGGLGLPTESAEAAAVLAAALRIATADRRRHLGDPDFVHVPAAGVVSAAFARERAAAGGGAVVPDMIAAGDARPYDAEAPPPRCAGLEPFGPAAVRPAAPALAAGTEPAGAVEDSDNADAGEGETTHLAVVDARGNAVSLTFTQGSYFGSGVWAAGTFLNNAMGIFAADPASPNHLRPRRAPASTTTPTMIVEDGRVRMVVGSPGGARIPHAVVQAIVYALDYGLHPAEALRMPRIFAHPSAPRIEFEQGFRGEVLGALHGRGYRMQAMPPLSLYFGGVQLIENRNGRWIGAADPRRDGGVAAR